MTLANEWSLLRDRVDREAFSRGRLGPYQLGESLRMTAAGQVVVALHASDPRVAELEILDPVRMARVEHAILEDVNQSIGLDHRHLAQVLGGGIADGLVYVARTHRLGRTLDEVIASASAPSFEVGPGVVYSAVEAIRFLSEQGPAPGACSLGGFDPRDVLLGYDGSITLLSLGLRGLREVDRSAEADVESAHELVSNLEAWLGRPLVAVDDQPAPAELLRRVRRAHGELVAHRRTHVGAFLRDQFPERIRSERAFYGLATLH